jgi:hypothetical protein
MTVLLFGATGRIGSFVLCELLTLGVPVKAIVRNQERLSLSKGQRRHNCLTVVEANFTEFTVEEMKEHLHGVTMVISTIGHNMTLEGIVYEELFVLKCAKLIIEAIISFKPPHPIRFLHLSTAGTMHPDGRDGETRGVLEQMLLGSLYYLTVPLRDYQDTIEYLYSLPPSKYVEWIALRPGRLAEGESSPYVMRSFCASFDVESTATIVNVARAVLEFYRDVELWDLWKMKMPVIVDGVEEN